MKNFHFCLMILFCGVASIISNGSSIRNSIIANENTQIAKSILLKNVGTISVSTINGDTLYLISGAYLFEINLKNGNLSTNHKVSKFLENKMNMGDFASQIYVCNSGFYVSFGKQIFVIKHNGFPELLYDHDREIYFFSITKNSNILISSVGNVTLVDKYGGVLSTDNIRTLSTTNYFAYNDGIGYFSLNKIILISAENSKIEKKVFDFNSNKYGEMNFYPSYAINSCLYGFSYDRRDEILEFDLINCEINDRIPLLYSDIPSQMDIQNEEGIPNFRIFGDDYKCFVIILHNDVLSILPVRLRP